VVDKRIDELENDRLVDLLFQLLLRRVRAGSVQADVLVVLGADRVRPEALVDHAGHSSFAVVLMFEYLRRDAIELIGTGGAAAAFMALGNHREAREAANSWLRVQVGRICTHGLRESLTHADTRCGKRGVTGRHHWLPVGRIGKWRRDERAQL
jgi:hypothetical protein